MEKQSGFCAIFVGDDENVYNYIVGSKNKDCKELAAKMRELFSAKGGGNSQMIQGSVSASEVELASMFV